MKFAPILFVLFVSVHSSAIPLILDTDIGPFTDDVGAYSVLTTFAKQGLIDIRAIVASNAYEGAVGVIDALNHYTNQSNILIGITKDPKAFVNKYKLGWIDYVLENYPHPTYTNNSDADDAVKVYRKVLAAAQDKSVTVLTIGHLTNMANLLRSKGDEYSSKTGKELVRAKVSQTVIMGGMFPRGDEYNIIHDAESAQYTTEQWPTPILFTGFEIGVNILCDETLLNNTALEHSPIRIAYELQIEKFGKADGCFDVLTAYMAIKGLSPLWDEVYGTIKVDAKGHDEWTESKTRTPFSYAKQIASNETIADTINPLMEN